MLWQMVFLSVFYLCVEVCQATQGIPSDNCHNRRGSTAQRMLL
jgi:hypothetical protein